MEFRIGIEYLKEQAVATLAQIDSLDQLTELGLPGEFVFSPPNGSRLCVRNMEDLHAARAILRERFGWKDHLTNKFYSCGMAIVVYKFDNPSKLPLPFDLWVEAPPESFPAELLGGCVLEKVTREEYQVVCPIE